MQLVSEVNGVLSVLSSYCSLFVGALVANDNCVAVLLCRHLGDRVLLVSICVVGTPSPHVSCSKTPTVSKGCSLGAVQNCKFHMILI